jgi:hypothetical protein
MSANSHWLRLTFKIYLCMSGYGKISQGELQIKKKKDKKIVLPIQNHAG